MTTTAQRQHIAHLIGQACQSGARLQRACQQIGIACCDRRFEHAVFQPV